MNNEIMMVVAFIVIVVLFCFTYNKIMMKIYHNGLNKMKLVNPWDDGNSDFKVKKAIKKISLPTNKGIKVKE